MEPTGDLEGLPAIRFHVVLSGHTVGGLGPPCPISSWIRTYPHVATEAALDVAVFHGLPSLAERGEYCRGAQVPLPPRIPGLG